MNRNNVAIDNSFHKIGDGDLDILMSGTNDSFEPRTLLYLNNGIGQFTELTDNNLQQTFFGTNAFSDLDNDGIGSSLRRMYEYFDIKETKYKKISLLLEVIKISNKPATAS